MSDSPWKGPGLRPMSREGGGQEFPVPPFWHGERPCWLATDVGRALGYARQGEAMRAQMSREWAEDMVRGKDYDRVRPDTLQGAIPDRWQYVPSVLVLYESGMHMVLQRTRKPAGKALRRWFADHVMPQLARDGRYAPERTVIDGEIKFEPSVEELIEQGPEHWKHLPAGRRAALMVKYRQRQGHDFPPRGTKSVPPHPPPKKQAEALRQLGRELAEIGADPKLRAAVAIAATESEISEGQGDIHARIARARELLGG
jgi:prophage antirepressor-like protein